MNNAIMNFEPFAKTFDFESTSVHAEITLNYHGNRQNLSNHTRFKLQEGNDSMKFPIIEFWEKYIANLLTKF